MIAGAAIIFAVVATGFSLYSSGYSSVMKSSAAVSSEGRARDAALYLGQQMLDVDGDKIFELNLDLLGAIPSPVLPRGYRIESDKFKDAFGNYFDICIFDHGTRALQSRQKTGSVGYMKADYTNFDLHVPKLPVFVLVGAGRDGKVNAIDCQDVMAYYKPTGMGKADTLGNPGLGDKNTGGGTGTAEGGLGGGGLTGGGIDDEDSDLPSEDDSLGDGPPPVNVERLSDDYIYMVSHARIISDYQPTNTLLGSLDVECSDETLLLRRKESVAGDDPTLECFNEADPTVALWAKTKDIPTQCPAHEYLTARPDVDNPTETEIVCQPITGVGQFAGQKVGNTHNIVLNFNSLPAGASIVNNLNPTGKIYSFNNVFCERYITYKDVNVLPDVVRDEAIYALVDIQARYTGFANMTTDALRVDIHSTNPDFPDSDYRSRVGETMWSDVAVNPALMQDLTNFNTSNAFKTALGYTGDEMNEDKVLYDYLYGSRTMQKSILVPLITRGDTLTAEMHVCAYNPQGDFVLKAADEDILVSEGGLDPDDVNFATLKQQKIDELQALQKQTRIDIQVRFYK